MCWHQAAMDQQNEEPDLAGRMASAAASTMETASSLANSTADLGNSAVVAACSTGTAMAELDLPKAASSFAEFTVTTVASAAVATSAVTVAVGSVAIQGLSVYTSAATTVASGTYSLASNAASSLASAVVPTEGEAGFEDGLQEEAAVSSSAKNGHHLEERRCKDAERSRVGCGGSCTAGIHKAWRGATRCCSRPSSANATIPSPKGHGVNAVLQSAQATQISPGEHVSESELSTQSSRVKERHFQDAPWHPTVLLYDVSADPPPQSSADRRHRRAYQLPLNARQPCHIDNEHFVGSFLFIHRLPEQQSSSADSPYQEHFATKTRRWEARVQGRFKHKPQGTLWTGCVLEDFDYTDEPTWAASAFSAATVPMMELVIGEKFHFSWGTRGAAADREGAELASIVTNPAGYDQFIVTRSGESPPNLDSNLDDLGFRRNAMGSSEYRKAVQQAVDNVNTDDIWTFCVWGTSRYIDVMNSSIVSQTLGSISYAGLLDEWPAHFVLYSLDPRENDSRHLESRKTYFVDIMVWSSDMDLPKLPNRYMFRDARTNDDADDPSATTNGVGGFLKSTLTPVRTPWFNLPINRGH